MQVLANGKWQIANCKLQMENGKLRIENLFVKRMILNK